MNDPIVIIGTGLAGYNLAREYRKLDQETPLLLVTADDGRSYSKPMLSAAFEKGKDADGLAMASAEQMAEQLNAAIRVNTRVSALEPNEKQILIGEERIRYSRLVLAWGAQVLRAPLGGSGAGDVLSVNDLEGYGVLRKHLAGKRHVLIMGAGLIGCEFASDLAEAGFEVTIAAPDSHLLQQLIPATPATMLQAALEEKGIAVRLGPLVESVHRSPEGLLTAHLSDATSLDADVIISAIGLRPQVDLAATAGIEVGRGIVTDQTLRTSHEDVYAIGDCAEVCGHALQFVQPLSISAKALAKTLAGEPTRVHYPAMPVAVKTPACPVVVLPPPRDLDGNWMFDSDATGLRGEYRTEDGQLRGFVLCGDRTKERMVLTRQAPDLLPAD